MIKRIRMIALRTPRFLSTLFLLGYLLFLTGACTDSKRTKLEAEVTHKVADDLRVSIVKTIEGAGTATFGVPIPLGSILNMVATKEKQDSLLITPILPYLKKEMDQLSTGELETYLNNTSERLQFLVRALIHNKDQIASDLSKQIPLAKQLLDMLAEYLKTVGK